MQIDTNLISALMALRQMDARVLARLVTSTESAINNWLQEGSDSVIGRDGEKESEILKVLGIVDGELRTDIVHYWHVHESLFSRTARNYRALDCAVHAFGPATCVAFVPAADPMVSLSPRTVLGLQFPKCRAIVEVTSHCLRSIGFSTAVVDNVQWSEGASVIFLNAEQYAKLEPGYISSGELDAQVAVLREKRVWEQLSESSNREELKSRLTQLLAEMGGPVDPSSANASDEFKADTDLRALLRTTTKSQGTKKLRVSHQEGQSLSRAQRDDLSSFGSGLFDEDTPDSDAEPDVTQKSGSETEIDALADWLTTDVDSLLRRLDDLADAPYTVADAKLSTDSKKNKKSGTHLA